MTDPQAPSTLPSIGRPADEVMADLTTKRSDDVRWADGRTFGLVFDGGEDVRAVAEQAARLYLHENALNTLAFPSLGSIQSEICGWTSDLLNGSRAAGFLTSGGTESILCAVLAARDRALAERGVTEPELVLPISAHAAFHKGAHMFGLRTRTVPVTDEWTTDLDAMADAVGPDTALVVASAPQYPQGTVDPVPEVAAMAVEVGASCHVDACMGGFVLPFAELEGRTTQPWDFRVEGVTSISADLHKLGYAPKGVSVILHRSRELRRYQTFDFDGWLAGRYITPNMQGTRSGLPMAAAWAVLQYLGVDGYRRLVRTTLDTADTIRSGIRAIDGLRILGNPVHHLLAISAEPEIEDETRRIDLLALGEAMADRGWHLDRQGPPPSLHMTVSAGNTKAVNEFLADLSEAAEQVRGGATGEATQYATLE
ncbi:MAG: aminotransferase class V-fold PLP-dependent enzyme [Acidimicrobiales bacterium]|nr:aminotransferase class V-fold PLP-dependent enzyme [Acidimicrobiales bacterium]MDP7411105.1 aminotransferase class V-fold PLP-dependent enzyme [Acidimicrobiales bacterium]MEE1522973.1 aminotransferase class V-fold PLP-dependent enzyme [Acidimicrobiales bacterium]